MSKQLEKIKNHIARSKKKNPVYNEILNFYEKVLKEQLDTNPTINVADIQIREDLRKLQLKEGFPLINKNDFILDIPSSIRLFKSICKIGKKTTNKMKKNIQKIEKSVNSNKLKIDDLLKRYSDSAYQAEIIKKLKLDNTILGFLIQMSIKPSIEANVEKLKDQVDLKNWLKGYCPICGSLPHMSELKGEGQRFFLCSSCNFKWPSERLKCPFCENSDHEKLHYFYAEGQEDHRVDVCDKCKKYIKTLDARKLDYEPDLNLEDILTIHLDILATKKGFKRHVPSLWGY